MSFSAASRIAESGQDHSARLEIVLQDAVDTQLLGRQVLAWVERTPERKWTPLDMDRLGELLGFGGARAGVVPQGN